MSDIVEFLNKICEHAEAMGVGLADFHVPDVRAAAAEITALRERVAELKVAMEPLVAVCEADFIGAVAEEVPGRYEDHVSVSTSTDGESALTFGHIRRARAALKTGE